MLIKRDRLKKGMAKEIILQAAESVFAQSGYDGTTVDKIAEQAGVTKKLLYYHFKSKREILLELLRLHANDLSEHIDEIFPSGMKFSEKYIDTFIDNLLKYLKTKQNIIKIFIIEFVKENEVNDDLMLFEIIKPLLASFSAKFQSVTSRRIHLLQNEETVVDCDFVQIFQGIVPIFTFYAFGDKIGGYLGESAESMEQQFADLLKSNMKQFWLKIKRGQHEKITKISNCHHCSRFGGYCIFGHSAKRSGNQ